MEIDFFSWIRLSFFSKCFGGVGLCVLRGEASTWALYLEYMNVVLGVQGSCTVSAKALY